MRAPMIPGRKPDDDQREAMLRRLGIAEEKPPTSSRWDVLARDMEPVAPVQTPPPMVDEAPAAAEPLPSHEPIPMAEAMRAQEALEPEPEPVAPPPVIEAPTPILRAVEPEPAPEPGPQAVVEPVRVDEPEPEPAPQRRIPDASYMAGWGEESIPEDDDIEAELFEEPAPLAAAPAPEARWMDEPLAQAPRREELLPKMDRAVSYNPQPAADNAANDEDLTIPEPQAVAPVAPPVMEAPVAPPVATAPVAEVPVARAPAVEPAPEPVVQPVAPEPVVEAPVLRQTVIEPPAPEPEPEPIIQGAAPVPQPQPEPPVVQRAAPEPLPEPPVMRQAPAPEPVAESAAIAPRRVERQPEPEPAPPVDSALREMRAELEAMRKQFQTAPAVPVEAAPMVASIPYDGRRRSRKQTDVLANARMVVWTLAIVAALWVTFHGMKAAQSHQARQDHILATVTGTDADDDDGASDQQSDQKSAHKRGHKRDN
jgi:hypothetical protein